MTADASNSSRLAFALILIIGISLFAAPAMAQGPNEELSIEWQHYLPGISGSYVIQTSDGGYLALGQNAAIDTVSVNFTNFTTIASKTDSAGNLIWTRVYDDTLLTTVIQTGNGYVLAGSVGGYGAGLVKIDIEGNVLWNKTYSPFMANYVPLEGVELLYSNK